MSPKDVRRETITGEDHIIQRYIHRPLLLKGLKHDLRVYVLIASVEPFVVYINREGLARFCTEKYELPTKENKIKENMHFTNYSLNKHSDKYVLTDECFEANDGSKRTLESYWASMKEEGHEKEPVSTYYTRFGRR